MQKRFILAVSVVAVALVAGAARAEFVMWDDSFAPGFQTNTWDGAAVDSTFAHTGTSSLTRTGVGAAVYVRNDPTAGMERTKLGGNTYVQFWVNFSVVQLDKVMLRLQNGTSAAVTRELKPSTGAVIEASTDGTNFSQLTNWNQVQANTWTCFKLDFATNFAAVGFTPTADTYFYFVGMQMAWNSAPDGKLWLDDAVLGGAAPDPVYHPGDANMDGVVTDADYTLWADNYNATGATWEQGDFNEDGTVTDADYTIWADHYGHTNESPVPEPATLSLLGLGLMGLIRRRK